CDQNAHDSGALNSFTTMRNGEHTVGSLRRAAAALVRKIERRDVRAPHPQPDRSGSADADRIAARPENIARNGDARYKRTFVHRRLVRGVVARPDEHPLAKKSDLELDDGKEL